MSEWAQMHVMKDGTKVWNAQRSHPLAETLAKGELLFSLRVGEIPARTSHGEVWVYTSKSKLSGLGWVDRNQLALADAQ